MGVFDFLKPKSALEKAAKQVREEYAQPDYRRGAMEKLFEIGTPEAFEALLRRFTVNANGQIADEQEKKDLVNELVRVGDESGPSIEKFIRGETKALTFPIRAFMRIKSREEARATLLETLESHEPMDHRTTLAKVALIDALNELVDAETSARILPYLDDHHDDVQASVIELLETHQPEGTAEALGRVCGSDEHSGRIKRQSAKTLANLGLSVRAVYDSFDEELKETFLVGKKGQLVVRPSA